MDTGDDELIPPTDPRFVGRELSADELADHTVANSEYLRGVRWRRARWRERPAVVRNQRTGEERAAVWDHDHCHFCRDGFSERYEGDRREGWTAPGPAGLPPAEWQADYHWVCPECFERFRAHFGWTVEPAP